MKFSLPGYCLDAVSALLVTVDAHNCRRCARTWAPNWQSHGSRTETLTWMNGVLKHLAVPTSTLIIRVMRGESFQGAFGRSWVSTVCTGHAGAQVWARHGGRDVEKQL